MGVCVRGRLGAEHGMGLGGFTARTGCDAGHIHEVARVGARSKV